MHGRWLAALVVLGLGLPEQTHAAPSPIHASGVGAMAQRLRARFHMPRPVKRLRHAVAKRVHLFRGHCTLAADRLQAHLPRRLASCFERARLLNPGALSDFAVTKFKQDPKFLATFGVVSPIAWHTAVPIAIGLGVNPALALGGHELIETPFDLAVILLRQHHLRTDRSKSLWGTTKALGREYVASARRRRERNRRFVHLYEHLAHARAAQSVHVP